MTADLQQCALQAVPVETHYSQGPPHHRVRSHVPRVVPAQPHSGTKRLYQLKDATFTEDISYFTVSQAHQALLLFMNPLTSGTIDSTSPC